MFCSVHGTNCVFCFRYRAKNRKVIARNSSGMNKSQETGNKEEQTGEFLSNDKVFIQTDDLLYSTTTPTITPSPFESSVLREGMYVAEVSARLTGCTVMDEARILACLRRLPGRYLVATGSSTGADGCSSTTRCSSGIWDLCCCLSCGHKPANVHVPAFPATDVCPYTRDIYSRHL
jgi:hypothetical protein